MPSQYVIFSGSLDVEYSIIELNDTSDQRGFENNNDQSLQPKQELKLELIKLQKPFHARKALTILSLSLLPDYLESELAINCGVVNKPGTYLFRIVSEVARHKANNAENQFALLKNLDEGFLSHQMRSVFYEKIHGSNEKLTHTRGKKSKSKRANINFSEKSVAKFSLNFPNSLKRKVIVESKKFEAIWPRFEVSLPAKTHVFASDVKVVVKSFDEITCGAETDVSNYGNAEKPTFEIQLLRENFDIINEKDDEIKQIISKKSLNFSDKIKYLNKKMFLKNDTAKKTLKSTKKKTMVYRIDFTKDNENDDEYNGKYDEEEEYEDGDMTVFGLPCDVVGSEGKYHAIVAVKFQKKKGKTDSGNKNNNEKVSYERIVKHNNAPSNSEGSQENKSKNNEKKTYELNSENSMENNNRDNVLALSNVMYVSVETRSNLLASQATILPCTQHLTFRFSFFNYY